MLDRSDPGVPEPTPPSPPLIERVRIWVDDVADATGTGARTLMAGCLVVGLAAGVLFWLTRQAPEPVESTLPVVDPASVTTTSEAPGPVVVHIAGAVGAPGVQRLPAGSRVIDAVDAAGGLTRDADAARVNLAAELVDGTQIYVPATGENPAPVVAAGNDPATDAGPVDLNTADAELLETLPGVGPATAAAILDHRERNGAFTSVDGLLEVRGIGEAKLAQLRDLVRV